jgi:predicted 3-demethylubiquinone-9 3-methyltransferase (glyoxalase superfamily)
LYFKIERDTYVILSMIPHPKQPCTAEDQRFLRLGSLPKASRCHLYRIGDAGIGRLTRSRGPTPSSAAWPFDILKETKVRCREAPVPKTRQKITPFLWFDDQAEDAVKFYVSIFKGSKIRGVTRYDEEGAKAAGRPKGSVMTVAFELDGQEFTALNGGPIFKFTEAISFVVNCETQQEVDYFWAKLSAGGQEVQCGWLKDRFGVSWQVVPTVLPKMLQDKDREKSKRVMAAMLKMKKIDIAALKKAYAGRSGSAG